MYYFKMRWRLFHRRKKNNKKAHVWFHLSLDLSAAVYAVFFCSNFFLLSFIYLCNCKQWQRNWFYLTLRLLLIEFFLNICCEGWIYAFFAYFAIRREIDLKMPLKTLPNRISFNLSIWENTVDETDMYNYTD